MLHSWLVGDLKVLRARWWCDPAAPDLSQVDEHNETEQARRDDDVQRELLPDVHDVPDRSDTHRVERILGLLRDVLTVPVGLIRKPVNAVTTASRKASTPVTQVNPRPPRHAIVKKLASACAAMNKKKACTPQKWALFTAEPSVLVCHHCTPPTARMRPLARTTMKEAKVSTPIVYSKDET